MFDIVFDNIAFSDMTNIKLEYLNNKEIECFDLCGQNICINYETF